MSTTTTETASTPPKAEVYSGGQVRVSTTDPTRHGGDAFVPASVDVDGKTEFFYLKGWKLWAIMCTLYLNTLLAALDVVSTVFSFHSFVPVHYSSR
jgi:hypothetical protein